MITECLPLDPTIRCSRRFLSQPVMPRPVALWACAFFAFSTWTRDRGCGAEV